MPPIVPRKRLRSTSPAPEPPPKRAALKHTPPAGRNKNNVFQTLDTPPTASRTLSQTKALLEQQDDDSDPSSPESDSDEFEDVPLVGSRANGKRKAQDGSASESEDETWEDALGIHPSNSQNDPIISGDIALTISAQPATFAKLDGKKGPSKIERHIRNMTHCMHVQFLMFHNLTRNAWVQDDKVQKVLVEHMTTGCWREMDRYWRDAGIKDGHEKVVKGAWGKKRAESVANGSAEKGTWTSSGKSGVKVYESPIKGKSSAAKAGSGASKSGNKAQSSKSKDMNAQKSERNARDWGATSDRLEPNTPNLSAGDPLLRLLRYLCAFWKGKFKITAPSLRKRGYLSPAKLEAETNAWKEGPSDARTFGERIEGLEGFRELARKCEGSNDVGQQLFTALLRGLGIEARMVASLQPAGFGWSKVEEGKPKDLEKLKTKSKIAQATSSKKSTPRKKSQVINGTINSPIDLSDSDLSDLSSAISISSGSEPEPTSTKIKTKQRKYDQLPNPTYWTEAISHLTHTPISVSPLPKTLIATASASDALLGFYCRGAAADKAQQVFAYLIAYSSDGTAKDVTTRYLPKRQWPGRTKGFRVPVEKIPIHNKRGKVVKWEEWDWFKSVLRPYARSRAARKPWDEIEEEGDLVALKPVVKKETVEDGGKETLQGYKNSAKYVLERHLRREEALKPGAKIVRHFVTGKNENEKKEPVYQRKDIANCKTVESWHKEGREVIPGQQPLKYVPTRAMTVNRKREIEERERIEGEKVMQGLYSRSQTDWIIPDPIVNGKIPRNAFGNIDVYVQTMIPAGAVHIPLRGTARVCKKLKIDFAEACTGFEFGKQRAVPVLTGVVVAAENEDMVIDQWEIDEAEKIRKEKEKKEKVVLGLWKKFFVGLRIMERMKREYGDDVELPAPSARPTVTAPAKKTEKTSEYEIFNAHSDFEGGFLREEPGPSTRQPDVFAQKDEDMAGGFIHQDEDMAGGFTQPDEEIAGTFLSASQEEPAVHSGLTIDHGEQAPQPLPTQTAENAYQAPISLHSAAKQLEGQDDEQPEGDGGEEEGPIVSRKRGKQSTRGKATTSRGRGRALTGSRGSISRRKTLLSDDEENGLSSARSGPELSSPPSDSEPSDASSDEVLPTSSRARRKATTPPARAPPKRKATRKSEAVVKSHLFEHESDVETDLTDVSPVKKTPTKRGTSARGRGRGRGKGRGRKS
jgi:xeroderma pigmentosum group C-complementing protein